MSSEKESKKGWFGEIYEGFLLRDLLSFIVPGSIVILGLYIILSNGIGEENLLNRCNFYAFRKISGGAAIGIYILFFGIVYVVGLTIQAIGIKLGMIKLYSKKEDSVIYGNSEEIPTTKYCKHNYLVQEFRQHATEYEEKREERNIVLMQTTGNTAVSLLLLIIVYGIKFFPVDCLGDWDGYFFILVWLAIPCRFLFWEHHELVDRDFSWRMTKLRRENYNRP